MGLLNNLFGGSRDSERSRQSESHHVVEIEGFGPITVRSLSKKDMEQIHEGQGGDRRVGVALAIQRGLVEPKFTELDPAQLEGHDDVIDAIAMAILDRSWPNVEMTDDLSGEPRKHKPKPYDPVERQKHVRLSIHGESHYQDALREICGRKKDEEVDIEYIATLVPEPENPYDSNAVRVEIDGMQVGYLSRGNARRYHRRIVRLLEEGGDPTVEAYIGAQGPEGENPNIGVTLHIPKDSPLLVPLSK